ncbi:hypothetical protein Droror1_Dr00025157 [Drosera rotundifolia]
MLNKISKTNINNENKSLWINQRRRAWSLDLTDKRKTNRGKGKSTERWRRLVPQRRGRAAAWLSKERESGGERGRRGRAGESGVVEGEGERGKAGEKGIGIIVGLEDLVSVWNWNQDTQFHKQRLKFRAFDRDIVVAAGDGGEGKKAGRRTREEDEGEKRGFFERGKGLELHWQEFAIRSGKMAEWGLPGGGPGLHQMEG